MPATPDELFTILEHLKELNAGKCSISKQDLSNEKNTELRQVLEEIKTSFTIQQSRIEIEKNASESELPQIITALKGAHFLLDIHYGEEQPAQIGTHLRLLSMAIEEIQEIINKFSVMD